MLNQKATTIAGVALLLLSAACITPPPKQDPYAELMIEGTIEGAEKTYPDTDLALVYSKNTLATRKYLAAFTRSGMSLFRQNYFPSAKFDVDRVFTAFTKILEKHFRSVMPIETFADAGASGAGLVAMLDVTAEIAPPPSGPTTTFSAQVIFLTPDKRQIDVLKASATGAVGKKRNDTKIPETSAKAYASIDTQLAGSQRLARFSGPARKLPVAAAPPRRTYRSDVDTPNYHLAENPDNFAVVIGIEDYANIPSALFAERDAKAMRAHLVALGYPRRNIIYLTGQRAGKTGIEKYLNEWLPRNVKKESKVFFYFSGHGAPSPESGQAYLMPWDGDAKYLATTGYSLKTLYRRLNSLKVKQVIVAMDSCFSGAGGRSVIAKGLRPLVTKIDTSESTVGKLVVFSASGSNEVTGSADDQGHGLFTYQFLKGLQASRGETTLQELYDYLRPRVEEGARRDNRDQTPGLLPEGNSERKTKTLR